MVDCPALHFVVLKVPLRAFRNSNLDGERLVTSLVLYHSPVALPCKCLLFCSCSVLSIFTKWTIVSH